MTLPRFSPRRRSRLADEAAFREQLFSRALGVCDWCRRSLALEQHHIAQGQNRQPSAFNLACSLALCHECHVKIQGILDTRQIGLAIMSIRHASSYSLSEFYRVTARRWPYEEEIAGWRLRLSLTETRR